MTPAKSNATQNIGAFNHPAHGEYYVWYNSETKCYGLTRSTKTAPHCGYGSLASLFKAKDI